MRPRLAISTSVRPIFSRCARAIVAAYSTCDFEYFGHGASMAFGGSSLCRVARRWRGRRDESAGAAQHCAVADSSRFRTDGCSGAGRRCCQRDSSYAALIRPGGCPDQDPASVLQAASSLSQAIFLHRAAYTRQPSCSDLKPERQPVAAPVAAASRLASASQTAASHAAHPRRALAFAAAEKRRRHQPGRRRPNERVDQRAAQIQRQGHGRCCDHLDEGRGSAEAYVWDIAKDLTPASRGKSRTCWKRHHPTRRCPTIEPAPCPRRTPLN